MVAIRFIQGPSKDTVDLLLHRMNASGREKVRGMHPGAIGMFQAKLPDLYYYADQAVKTSRVIAVEIQGTCPQHASTVALFGDTEAIRQALRRIRQIDAGGEGIEI